MKKIKWREIAFLGAILFFCFASPTRADTLDGGLLKRDFVTGDSSQSNTQSKNPKPSTSTDDKKDSSNNWANNLDNFDPNDPNSPSGQATKKNRENLSLYTSYIIDGKNPLTAGGQNMIHSVFVQGSFGIAKAEYQLVNTVKNSLGKNNILTDKAQTQFQTSKSVYDKLIGAGFGYIAVFGILLTLIRAMIKGRVPQAVLSIFLVLSINAVFFGAGNDFVSKTNTAVAETKDGIVQTIAGTDSTDLKNIMVTQPFLYLNFDNVTLDKNGVSNITQAQIDQLLGTKGDSDSVSTVNETLKSNHLKYSEIGSKIATATSAVVANTVYLIVFSFLSVVSFVFQLLALLLIDFAWVVAILSFYPAFSNAMFMFIKKIFQFILIGLFSTVGGAVIILFNSIVTDILVSSNIKTYAMQNWLKVIIVMGVYIFRNQLGGLIQKGELQVVRLIGKIQNNASRAGSQTFGGIKSGLVAGATAGAVNTGLLKNVMAQRAFGNGAGVRRNLSAMRKERQMKKVANKLKEDRLSPEKREKQVKKGQKLVTKKDKKLNKLDRINNKENKDYQKNPMNWRGKTLTPEQLKKKKLKQEVMEKKTKGYDSLNGILDDEKQKQKNVERKRLYKENREERQKAIKEKTRETSQLAKEQPKPEIAPKYGKTKSTVKSERKRQRKVLTGAKVNAQSDVIRRQMEEQQSGITRY